MTPESLRRALACDEQTGRRAVRKCGESLREGRAEEPTALIELLRSLATDASPVLRQALADVCDTFADGMFDETQALLLADPDAFVRAAAEAAGHRRAHTRRRATKAKAEETLALGALEEIERDHGKDLRLLAEHAVARGVERGVEHFAAKLAHEVTKTEPAILRALATLELEIDRPERSALRMKELVATVRERSRFAYSMIRRARDYAERAKPVYKDQSLAAIVTEAHAQLVDRLGPRAARLAFQSDVDPALRIEADRYLLLQALQNVLQNAAEAYGDQAARLAVRVSATVRRGGSEVVLVVADDGSGIAPERRETLFVPFSSRKPGGTGVGLLIARRAIDELHGGELTLEPGNADGSGTRVTMLLPAKQKAR